MYHAIGKQGGTPGNSGDLTGAPEQAKMDIYQEERLVPAADS